MNFIDTVLQLPTLLQQRVQFHWDAYQTALNQSNCCAPSTPEFMTSVAKVWAGSEFVAAQCVKAPEHIKELFESGDILKNYSMDTYIRKLAQELKTVKEINQLKKTLRLFRNREIVRIIWRDLAGWSDYQQVTWELTALAEACIDQAAQLLYRWQCERDGTPALYKGQQQDLLIIALGKLGGQELNLSSDVDLLFAYAERGETTGVASPISHELFFNRLGRDFIQVLNHVTGDGFVYRVDMRLRPFGESGALVMHFAALDNYYNEQGRDWERYALMKARVISGNRTAGRDLMEIIVSFVYRRYVDFSAIEALRKMHASIVEEVKTKQLENNIKLGRGGIRAIEFICQAYQFIWGGEITWLQNRRLLIALKLLAEMEIISAKKAERLKKAYCFLRTVENHMQAVEDRQTHKLPEKDVEKIRLAYGMGFSSWENFCEELEFILKKVNYYFEKLVAKPKHKQVDLDGQLYDNVTSLWLRKKEEKSIDAKKKEDDFCNNTEILRLLNLVRSSRQFMQSSALGLERLNALMPILLMLIEKTENPEVTLQRLLDLVLVMIRRSAYMVLLLENPKALEQLVKLCAISPAVADLIARYPRLLGQLLDTKRLYAPLDLITLRQQSKKFLDYIEENEIETQLENLRKFKLYNVFRVAVMDVTGVLPLMRVSDHLTNIAEVVLEKVKAIVWKNLVSRYGLPRGASVENSQFAIIAYGKFGGIELSYSSDLDLVFIYDNDPDQLTQAGASQEEIPNGMFYIRLAQQLVQCLGALSVNGSLYEVDTRLRPSGESGLLAASFVTFAEYEQNQAWTWEHQALVRARIVLGNDDFMKKFSAIRQKVLMRKRDPHKLAEEVYEMRAKMRAASVAPPADQFDLKQGIGGVADIEFIVQYCVLRYAASHPALITYTDNIRIIQALSGEGLLDMLEARKLSDAYRAYRAIGHRLDLQNQPSYVASDQLMEYRQAVIEIWDKFIERTRKKQ